MIFRVCTVFGICLKDLSSIIDFCSEYPSINITLKKTGGIYHDRFIVLDYGTEDERIFLCGASSKDAGASACPS